MEKQLKTHEIQVCMMGVLPDGSHTYVDGSHPTPEMPAASYWSITVYVEDGEDGREDV